MQILPEDAEFVKRSKHEDRRHDVVPDEDPHANKVPE